MNDKAGQATDELRELIREAHGAIKDLRAALAEHRKILADGARQARQAAAEAGQNELGRYSRHLQVEMNRNSAELAKKVEAARHAIVSMLIVKQLRLDPVSNKIEADFELNGNFDPDWPLPDGPDLDDQAATPPGQGRPDPAG